ncbi:MAG: YlbF family regulator [Oscillospiraceae bacterium]|nr:YlbF family regulator [Oscillospiraceae bacterium]
MDMIQMARELGKAIQQDERYIRLQKAKADSDNDQHLQELIGEFNLKRLAINNEAVKDDRSEDKLRELNTELRHIYGEIMRNENMTAYNEAKEALDAVLKRVNAIIALSAEGEDPETADLDESSCGGSCSSCAGCH